MPILRLLEGRPNKGFGAGASAFFILNSGKRDETKSCWRCCQGPKRQRLCSCAPRRWSTNEPTKIDIVRRWFICENFGFTLRSSLKSLMHRAAVAASSKGFKQLQKNFVYSSKSHLRTNGDLYRFLASKDSLPPQTVWHSIALISFY